MDETRKESRGGRDEFSWDDVRNSDRRAFYLGNSIKVNRDKSSDWYLDKSTVPKESKEEIEAERKRIIEQEKLQRLRQTQRNRPEKGT